MASKKRVKHESEPDPDAKRAAVGVVDEPDREAMLKQLVKALLPAELVRNHNYDIKCAETYIEKNVHNSTMRGNPPAWVKRANPPVPITGAHDLCKVAFIGSIVNYECKLQLVDGTTLRFTCERKDDPELSWSIDVNPDFDVFEAEFEQTMRRCTQPNEFRPVSTKPTWCYILLSMLVYTDQVFAPLDDEDAVRTQRDLPHADVVREMLNHFWDMDAAFEEWEETGDDKSCARLYYPFLVRLMTPEFALALNTETALGKFIFYKQSK